MLRKTGFVQTTSPTESNILSVTHIPIFIEIEVEIVNILEIYVTGLY